MRTMMFSRDLVGENNDVSFHNYHDLIKNQYFLHILFDYLYHN